MTTQAPDQLSYNGRKYDLHSDPFYIYIELNNIEINNKIYSTGNRKGYIARWSIKDNQLFLSQLLSSDDNFCLEKLFNTNKKIMAFWYTGEIIIPFGKTRLSDKSKYLYEYENEMIFNIKEGKVVKLIVNWGKNKF